MFRKLLVGAAALTMMTGAAFAQAATGSEGTSALDDPEMMKPFYTDEGMTTLRSDEEVAVAVKAMKDEDRARIVEECKNVNSPRASFCESFNKANQM